MKDLSRAFVTALLLAVPVATMAFAPGSEFDLWSGLEFKPAVGRWAQYQMTPAGEKPITLRVSVVGREDDHYWYETVIDDARGGIVITKMLVSGDPGRQGNLKRMILKPSGEPAMEMPVQMMMSMGDMGYDPQGEEPELPETKSVDLGVESITVPAGAFDARHLRFNTEDFVFDAWVSEDVSPYGVVKGTSKDFELILLSHGHGAESLITEEPQPFPMHGLPTAEPGAE